MNPLRRRGDGTKLHDHYCVRLSIMHNKSIMSLHSALLLLRYRASDGGWSGGTRGRPGGRQQEAADVIEVCHHCLMFTKP